MAQMWAPDGVLTTAGGGIGATGYELKVYADGGGMFVKVNVGHAWIKGVYFENDQVQQSPTFVAAEAQPRIDRVVARITWSQFSGTIAVIHGQPAVNPAPPPMARDGGSVWDLQLAQVLVAPGTIAITDAMVTDERIYTDLASQIPVGSMFDWPTDTPPRGYLFCGGQLVSAITYGALFNLLGTAFNNGAVPAGQFRLPDCRGRMTVGMDNIGGTAANTLPGANVVNIRGGSPGHTMAAAELVNHIHTVGPYIPVSDVASADHVHPVNPPATNTFGESTKHRHTAGGVSGGLTGAATKAHVHQVDPPDTTSAETNADHLHSFPAIDRYTEYLGVAANHDHAVDVGGQTSDPLAFHHHDLASGGIGGTGAQSNNALAPGGTTAPLLITGNDTSGHKHNWGTAPGTRSGAAGVADHQHRLIIPAGTYNTGREGLHHQHGVNISIFDSAGETAPYHKHGFDVSSFAIQDNDNNHVHSVDIDPFTCGGMTANHQHQVMINTTTGGTGSTTPFNTMPPYITVGKIIKW